MASWILIRLIRYSESRQLSKLINHLLRVQSSKANDMGRVIPIACQHHTSLSVVIAEVARESIWIGRSILVVEFLLCTGFLQQFVDLSKRKFQLLD